jgi:hypothetical protein
VLRGLRGLRMSCELSESLLLSSSTAALLPLLRANRPARLAEFGDSISVGMMNIALRPLLAVTHLHIVPIFSTLQR